MGSAVAISYGFFRLIWLLHHAIYPGHQLKDFWRDGVSFGEFAPSFLMGFSLVPAALALGIMFANCLFWAIPQTRRILDREAHGYPSTSYQHSQRVLGRFFCWAFPIGLALAITGAVRLRTFGVIVSPIPSHSAGETDAHGILTSPLALPVGLVLLAIALNGLAKKSVRVRARTYTRQDTPNPYWATILITITAAIFFIAAGCVAIWGGR
jgi:hypothetical protein